MRHRRKAKYFGVKTAHRKAMFRNMVTSLFRHGRITTTVPRAKELRRLAEKLITLAKDGSLHARRQVLSIVKDKSVVAKLFSEIAQQMASRNGGYTRIVKIGPRRGDGAMMCIIELVKESIKPQKSKAPAPKAEEAPTVIPQAVEVSAEEAGEKAETEQGAKPEESAEGGSDVLEESTEASVESSTETETASESGEESGQDEAVSAKTVDTEVVAAGSEEGVEEPTEPSNGEKDTESFDREQNGKKD